MLSIQPMAMMSAVVMPITDSAPMTIGIASLMFCQ
jgi:hypothetical protein